MSLLSQLIHAGGTTQLHNIKAVLKEVTTYLSSRM